MPTKVDVGRTLKDMPEVSKKKMFPSIFLSTEELPALKGKDVGGTGSLVADYKIKGKHLSDDEDGKESERFDIEITKMALSNKSSKDTDEENDDEEKNEKMRGKVKESLQRGKES